MKIQLEEQIRATRKLMGLIKEQEEGTVTLEERFAPIKGEEFTGVGTFTNPLGAKFQAKSSAIKQILDKIGGQREGRVKARCWSNGMTVRKKLLIY